MNEFEILAELIGIPDLKTQNRNQVNSTARQAIAFFLHKKGFSAAEIGVMQGRNRTTIIHQIKTFRGFLDYGDEMALEFWRKLNPDCQ